MAQPLAAPAGARRRTRTLGAVRPDAAGAAALSVAALYMAAAVLLVGGLHLPSAEAMVRTARLAALYDGVDASIVTLGLERPPLLSVLAMPFALVPALREHALAGALGTAVLGGAGVAAALGVARWAGMDRWATALYVAAFALHPLLLYSGAVGLPEALYASLLLAGVGQFMRWLDHESPGPVIAAGAMLGAAYLLRYNSLLVAAAVCFAIWWVARGRGREDERGDRAQAMAMAFAVPVAFVVGLWAIVAWFPHADATEFLRLASRLSASGGGDADVLRRMGEMRLDAPRVAAWVGLWTALIAPLSVVAIVAVAAHGVARRSRESLALALVLASVAAPEVVALFSGHGQAHVTHLFPMVVPAFAVFAYRERHADRGAAGRRRLQIAGAATLLAGSLAALAVLPLLPASDAPAPEVLRRIVERERAGDAGAAEVAGWLSLHASEGDVLIDPERSAAVMLAAGRLDGFRVPAEGGGLETLRDPYGVARHIVVRRRPPGVPPGVIERVHRGLYAEGAPFATLAFDAGEYRVYRVDAPVKR